MKITLLAIGKKMPHWITEGFEEYRKRLPLDYQLQLCELNMQKRYKQAPIQKLLEEEGENLLKSVPANNVIIALDRQGKDLDTETLARKLEQWHTQNQDCTLFIGGPEGLSKHCLASSHETWSLSKLTLPHPLTRVLVAEQLYRAWSILQHHPYHRGS